ncbi:hypothetical protein [Chromohalobacter israelensis]|uniref:hypothetical protein n=1 Tax=Chromohalobacter israelensis TaxID=141390 RepID=UPI00265C5A72|nr:hypothetical protein [Chromohalobacter salexigens]MDO0946109.1 hypothetical protein [Chromohalobacter salexigens]
MTKTFVLYMICSIFNLVGVLAFFYTSETTFDGHELMILAAVIGLGLYSIAVFTVEKKFSYGLFELVTFVSVAIIVTTALHFFLVSGKTMEASSQIIGKDKEGLKDGSFSYSLIVSTSDYGEQSIWVNEDIFNKLDTGENLKLILSEGLLGYKVVVGYSGS